MAEAFLKTVGGDRIALLAVLDSAVDTPRDAIGRVEIPVLVAAGVEDVDNGSAAALAQAFARGRYAELPGNHMSTVARPELGTAMVEFLS
jgi:pimeloyl-ACP methyl ester carboxylesterase